MKRKKSAGNSVPASVEHVSDLPPFRCHCDELAPIDKKLARQVHLLGVIIDELLSEFQWQNNQTAEQIRSASDFAESARPESMAASLEPVCPRRKTLFE